MPAELSEGVITPPQDTQTKYTTEDTKQAARQLNAPKLKPIPEVKAPVVPGAPRQPAPDQQTLQEQQAAAINSYIYARAQRYLAGSAFNSEFERNTPHYTSMDATGDKSAQWWTTHPLEFGNTISANVPEEHHRRLVKHLPSVYDWMAKHDRVAGIDGILTGMRLTALHIASPEIRNWAINYIDSIKQLSGPDQQAVIAYLMQLKGTTDPTKLLHEALHTRQGYVNAYEATPAYQAAAGAAARQRKMSTEEWQHRGPGMTVQDRYDFAQEQLHKLINDPSSGWNGPEANWSPELKYWQSEAQAADQARLADLESKGQLSHWSGDPLADSATIAKGVATFVGKGMEAQFLGGPKGAEEFNKALAPHIQNWLRDGNNLPFTVHWNPGYNPFLENLLHPSSNIGDILQGKSAATPEQQLTDMQRQYSLHHLSAQSEIAVAGGLATAGATLVFAPGLITTLGTTVKSLAELQGFMKILHGVNVITSQVGHAGQNVNVSGFGPFDQGLNWLTHAGGTVLSGTAAALHAGTAWADNMMLDIQDSLATGTATVAQNFGWNMSPMQANIAAQIEMAMLMESMGRVGSDIKVNLGMTADAAKGQLGVGDTLSETYRLSDSSIFHPWRAVMDPLVDHGVTQMMQYLHATDLPSVFERWNDSNFLGRRGMFDIISEWQGPSATGPTDWRTVLGKIRERYPMLPEQYAEMLARTPREQMLGASMDYIDGWGVSEFKSAKGQLGSLKAKLAKLELPDLTGTRATYHGEHIDPMSGYPEPIVPRDMKAPIVHYYDKLSEEELQRMVDDGWTMGPGENGYGRTPAMEGETLYPPGTIFPGTPEWYDLVGGPSYEPHPLEGRPRPVYRGDYVSYGAIDESKWDPFNLHGPGLYTTEDFTLAGGEPTHLNSMLAQRALETGDWPTIGYSAKGREDWVDVWQVPDSEHMTEAEAIAAATERINHRYALNEGPNKGQFEVSAQAEKLSGPYGNWKVNVRVQRTAANVGPHVSYGYIDIKNPFDLDHVFPMEEAIAIEKKAVASVLPELAASHQNWEVSDVNGDELRKTLVDIFKVYGHMSPADANWAAMHGLEGAGFDGMTHIGGNIMGDREHRVWIAFHSEQYHRGLTPAMLDEQAGLMAEKAALEDKIATLQSAPNEVITNLPTHSMPDFLHRVMYRPVGPVEGTFRTMLNFGRYVKRFGNWSYRTISGEDIRPFFEDKQSLVAKLVDKLDRRPQLRFANPNMPRAERQIIEDNNAQILDRILQRIGFTSEDAALLKGRLAGAKTQQEWYDVMSRDFLGSTGDGLHLLNKYMPDNTPRWLRDRILGLADNSVAPKYYQRVAPGKHGQSELNNLLDGELVLGDRAPLPAAPSMFKNSYTLPVNDIETALGTVSRWRARVGDVSFKKGDLFNNLAAQVFDWGKAGLALTTSVGKPLMMVANIPAIIATKMLDETMGNAMDPRILRQFHTRAEALDYFSRVDPRILGKVVANGSSWVGLDGTDIASSDIEHTAQQTFMHGMDRTTAESVAQRLVDMSTDPMLSRLAVENDPERMMAILMGDPWTGIDPNAEGILHFYRGQVKSSRGFNDQTKYWWKMKFGADTLAGGHEGAMGIARSWAGDGVVEHYYIDPNARILYQGTPEFDAIVGPNSEFNSFADPNAPYRPGSILPGNEYSQQKQLDDLYLGAKAAGYDVIHMADQDFLGTGIINPSVLRDPNIGRQPVMADERLQRFYTEQLRPQIIRSLEAFDIPVTEDTIYARGRQLMSDWMSTIHEATWNHPDLLDFVRHGRLGERGIPMAAQAKMDGELSHQYQSLIQEVDGLREHISKLDAKDDPTALIAAQQHLHDKLEQIDHIENTVLGVGDQTDALLGAGAAAEQIRQDTRKALADQVKRLWDGNELTPPDKFTVRTPHALLQTSSTTDVARSNARRLQDFMYRNGQFHFIGKAESMSAKGSFYSQRADAIAKGYIASGMAPDEAVALAEWKALDETRDFNYDISTKSTAERSIRNLMWFAPVQGELMYRWMYAIPATMGAWLPGAALMTGRLTNWYHMLKTSGLVHKDQYTGEDVISVPGLGALITHLANATGSDIKLPDTLQIPLLSINPHLFGIVKDPLPALSPGPSFLLDRAAAATHSPLLLDLSTMVSQGGTNQFVPSAINSLLGMYGINVGSHMMGTSYQRLQWDRAHDVGLQYAYTDLLKSGNTAPSMADYGLDSAAPNYIVPSAKNAAEIQMQTNAYQVAWAGWFSQLNTLADQYARGAYALNAISSSVLPGYIQESSTDQRAYQQFFKDNILPQIDAGADQGVISDTINKWLAQHPNSQAFAISYNYYTGKQWDTPFQVTDPEYAKQLFTQGVKAPMHPEDYANFLAGKAMIEGYRAQLNGAITAAAPDGKWQTLLRNWYKRGKAVEQYTQELNMFDTLNPDALRVYNDIQAAAQKSGHVYPHQGLVYQYVASAMNDLKLLAPGMFGGDIQGDYKAIISRLGQEKAALYQQFPGAANDPMTKGIDWYFTNVIDPYYKTVNPLYEQAKQLQAQGASKQEIADVYHQIDLARQQFDKPGRDAPTPEEFAYATLSPYDQKIAQVTWATQPISWLSKFQYQKVYGEFDPGINKLFNEQYKFNKTQFLPLYNSTTPTSKYGESLKAWADQQYLGMAQYWQKHGVPDAVRIMNLENGVPFERLAASGWEQNNPGVKTIFDLARQANEAITKAGNSPAGFSQTAVTWKAWFYQNLNNYMTAPETLPNGQPNKQVIQFHRAMDALSHSQRTVGTTGLHPMGLALYEEIFFGNYSLDKYPAPRIITNLFK